MNPTKRGLTVAYEDDYVTLYCGDSREFMAEAAHGGGNCVIVTDPPYGDTSLEWDRVVTEFPQYAAALTRDLWCFGSMRFWMENGAAFKTAGFTYAQEIVWQKHAGSGPNSDRFTRVHELAVQWYRGGWTDLQHDVPRTKWFGPDRNVRRMGNTPHRGDYAKQVEPWVDDGTRMMQSVIPVRNEHRRGYHPTQKPTGILRPLIEYSCPRDGLVLDPFAGSASTLVAARELGRKAVGVEINPDYCRAAAKRLSQTELLVA